jgi:hypothetical protein
LLNEIANNFKVATLRQLKVLIDEWLSDLSVSTRRNMVECGDASDPASATKIRSLKPAWSFMRAAEDPPVFVLVIDLRLNPQGVGSDVHRVGWFLQPTIFDCLHSPADQTLAGRTFERCVLVNGGWERDGRTSDQGNRKNREDAQKLCQSERFHRSVSCPNDAPAGKILDRILQPSTEREAILLAGVLAAVAF